MYADHESVVQSLLKQPSVDVKRIDNAERSVLSWAAGEDHGELWGSHFDNLPLTLIARTRKGDPHYRGLLETAKEIKSVLCCTTRTLTKPAKTTTSGTRFMGVSRRTHGHPAHFIQERVWR
jgi:hypothetical protein